MRGSHAQRCDLRREGTATTCVGAASMSAVQRGDREPFSLTIGALSICKGDAAMSGATTADQAVI